MQHNVQMHTCNVITQYSNVHMVTCNVITAKNQLCYHRAEFEYMSFAAGSFKVEKSLELDSYHMCQNPTCSI